MQSHAQPPLAEKLINRNRPERVEWFRNAGFGLFIHWSVDGQLGTVISHSLVGASEDYVKRYFEELPKTFNPKKFDPSTWAVQAKLAGFKYVVFTTKHHNGFCMYDSKTTDFDVASTPFRRDITAEVVQAFRAQGIGVGFYFSPDDFHVLHRQGITIARNVPEVEPRNNKTLLEHDRAQLRELLTNYGKIDVIFLDGPAEGSDGSLLGTPARHRGDPRGDGDARAVHPRRAAEGTVGVLHHHGHLVAISADQ